MTNETVRWHLTGLDSAGAPFVMGAYAMLLDETCWFLAVDFDGDSWAGDALAYAAKCRDLGVSSALERSRSGNGGHVWIFFEEALPATLARKLGAHILTETSEQRPDVGLRSYDRFFPNQDTLPRGGFGSLIALPLQHAPRQQGNSVFVDSALKPFPDQWKFLSSVKRIDRSHAENLVAAAGRRGRILGVRGFSLDEEAGLPWDAPPSRQSREDVPGPLPTRIDLVLGDQIYIDKNVLTPALRNRIIRLAAFQNPEFYRAQAMRLPTYGKPRIIACAEDLPEYVGLPRGCLEELEKLLGTLGIEMSIHDRRVSGMPFNATFQGRLRPEQQLAAEALVRHDTGVLAATTAFGKTVVSAWLIARRNVNTLVLVHRSQLMEQWVERLSEFLDLEAKEIGRLGGGRRKLKGKVDIALLQSLVRKGVVDNRVADYGQIIVDECHHISARSFELAVRRAKAKYILGLSATVARKDGHDPIIFMQCGPVRHEVNAKTQGRTFGFARHVIVRPTGFRSAHESHDDQRIEFQALCERLSEDARRSELICDDVEAAVQKGRWPLILTERTSHLEKLSHLLARRGMKVVTLRGGMRKQAMRDALVTLSGDEGDEHRVVVATGRFAGEGFDDPRLDTLFLAMPVSWRGTIAQYVGRLHRRHDGKRQVEVYDYADLDVPMLSRMFDRRCKGYEAVGYEILVPASALPGWPAEVLLPVDPTWKETYSASIRRLIRDGVDEPLADLFVHATRSFAKDAEGVSRARSASEAFLFRRLQSLQATRGRFRLNCPLPIPFAGAGRMEVDFLDPTARVVVEIDGPQHLDNPNAYRRDRLKDSLLQEHGYHVLRFLAEDVGARLDDVLDTILRTISRRERLSAPPHSG